MKRVDGAGAYDRWHGFVVAGGFSWPKYRAEHAFYVSGWMDEVEPAESSVEKTSDGASFSSLPDLPSPMRAGYWGRSCLVSLNNGGDLFITGVTTHDVRMPGFAHNTYVYKMADGIWEKVADMPGKILMKMKT